MSKEQQVIEQLLVLIQSDRYPIGSVLPSERKLSKAFKSSRNTVRNAIRKLEARGLLQVRSGSGCYLLAKEDTFERWRSALDTTEGKGLENLFEARYLLEPVIGALAAERIDNGHLSRLEDCVVRLSQAIIAGDTGDIIAGEMDFRNAIAKATGNPVLGLTISQLRATHRICGKVFFFLDDSQRDTAFADYVTVLNTMRHGDGQQAAEVLRQNLLRLCSFIVQYTDVAMPAVITDDLENRGYSMRAGALRQDGH